MEFEVRVVTGIESCFASLPLSLIQTLQSTSGGFLPPVLALELHSGSGGSWKVAWSGAASRSNAIEVARQLAECIRLEDHVQVHVKVIPTLSKAVMVSIEPCTEDDWEILELNSDLAEDAILKQVGIVYEGMKFPLWLHGHIVVTFDVVSAFPRKSVVQLVPGTEVAVAPKLRDRGGSSHQYTKSDSPAKGKFQTRALLRVQSLNRRMVHKFEFRGVEVGVGFTSAVFVHPETARNSSLENLQRVIILPKFLPSENRLYRKGNGMRNNSSTTEKKVDGSSPSREASRHAVVYVLVSDAAAKGHVMLPHSLRLFLKAGLHSWIYMKRFDINPKKNVAKLTLTPCRFKLHGKIKNSEDNKTSMNTNFKDSKNISLSQKDELFDSDVPDWSLHEELLTSVACVSPKQAGQRAPIIYGLSTQKEYLHLIHAWLIGQLKSISSYGIDADATSIVLANETLFHFEMINSKTGSETKEKPTGGIFEKGSSNGESPIELFYLLSASFEESLPGDLHNSFELSFRAENKSCHDIKDLEVELGQLELGEPVLLDAAKDRELDRNYISSIFSLSWLGTASLDAINRIQVLLLPSSAKLLNTYHLPLPGHVLIYGPPGSGKTSLATAVAKHFEEHEEILAHILLVSCSKLALEKSQTVRQIISANISEALVHSPSLLILDDLDYLVSSSDADGSQSSSSVIQLTEYLTDIIDEYGEKRQNSCGLGSVAFVATAQTLGKVPQSLTSSGRFDFHIQLPALAVSERGDILKHEIHKRSLQCSADVLSEVAFKCDGYDAYDLEILVDRAIHSAIGRYLSSHVVSKENEKPCLIKEDFLQAMEDFTPVAMRGLTKAASKDGRSGWEDVGGLVDIRNAIQEMVEMPSKYPAIFAQAPLRLRSNVLLYGPPGCGKTHIVGAAASACSLRFISIKGPELLNKYIGASEQAVRDLFTKAASAAPCLLFFDEFDSIAPKRGHDNTGVTDRVVNQFLTELDGVEALTGVFVFAATSRPDLLDAALLRPGRLDRLLFCDFPSWYARLDILTVLSRKLPLAGDVNLETIASMTDGFSGADLQALLSDAQLASVHELLDSENSDKSGQLPIISDVILRSVASRARPSVSESEKQRLYAIYNQFLDSKKSVNTQSRDAKGKRATLA